MESNINKMLNELEEKIKKGHKKYTIDFKLKVIELVHLNFSIHFISNKLNIDRKTIREWLKNEDSLKLVSNKDKNFDLIEIQAIILILVQKKNQKFIIGLLNVEMV
jgi:hypothetical protein